MTNYTKKCTAWIRQYFKDTNAAHAVIGISGGKDSTIAAALCKNALGPNHVYGILMPNGEQQDFEDAVMVCETLGIKNYTVNISNMYKEFNDVISKSLGNNLSKQAKINLAPKIRMSTLYAIAQTIGNARVCNTTNMDESLVGYGTLWGDTVGDFAPFKNLHVSEILYMGDTLGLPSMLVHKDPSDGLTGMTDETALGFSYFDVENMYNKYIKNLEVEFTEKETRAFEKMKQSGEWKRNLINIPSF